MAPDADYLAELPTLLRSAEQQLASWSRLCHELAEASGRSTPAQVATPRVPDSVPPPASGEVVDQVQALASQVHELATNLARQADALRAAVGSTTRDGHDLSPEHLRLRASEAERARLARDLHDGPAQHFANAVFETYYLQRLLARDPAAAAQGLAQLRDSLQQGVAEIRRCLFDLRLPAVEEVGLVALLRSYLPDYEGQFGVAVEAILPDEEPPVSADQSIAIFRILQEALTNARKHSGAQQIRVALQHQDNELNLIVEDDGRGFTRDRLPAGRYGLLGMQERAQLAHGRLEVDSRPGHGARIVLHVPLR